MTNINAAEIKAKIAKLLRLQASANENAAANAALLVEKLCRQHGISSAEVSADFDPEKDQAIAWDALAYGKRRDAAEVQLLSYVSHFFNGEVISKYRNGRTLIEVMATQGRRAEIEIYFEFLLETMNSQADRAKAAEDPHKRDRGFRQNFRKAFVQSIGCRLHDIRQEQIRKERKADSMPRPAGTSAPGLVAQKRRNIEQQAVEALCRKLHPRLGSGSSFTGASGSGSQHGRAAGAKVGLNRQVSTGRTLALAGR